jgi:hypothetical protein
MTSQQFRQRDTQQNLRGGETALVAAGGFLLGVAVAALAGIGAAAALFGRGWVWPKGGTEVHVLGGLLAGAPARGYPPAVAALLPSPTTTITLVVVAEVLYLGLAILVITVYLRYRRPTDSRSGMATRTEAAGALGLRRLHSVKSQIRPDLHPTRQRRGDVVPVLVDVDEAAALPRLFGRSDR